MLHNIPNAANRKPRVKGEEYERLDTEYWKNKKRIAELKSEILTSLLQKHGVKKTVVEPIPLDDSPMGMFITLGNDQVLEFYAQACRIDGPWFEDNLEKISGNKELKQRTKRQSELANKLNR